MSEGASAPITLGRYELIRELGHGGMAVVHLARARGPAGFERHFAIKLIHDSYARDEGFIGMFLDEARICASLHHPGIAQTFELGRDGEKYFLVMEHLAGAPLAKVLRAAAERGERMPPALAAWIVARVAEALHHAHEARDARGARLEIVHRDVTPHNVFLTYEGHPKLTDFGVARARDRMTQTQSGSVKGKIAYASPEQLRGDPSLDRRSDIFALGVVLWEASVGQRLFRGDTELQTVQRIATGYRVSPSSLLPDYPEVLEAIVARALAHAPEDRYPDAETLARALDAFVREAAVDGVGAADVAAFVDRMLPGAREADRAALTASADSVASYRRAHEPPRREEEAELGTQTRSAPQPRAASTSTSPPTPPRARARVGAAVAVFVAVALVLLGASWARLVPSREGTEPIAAARDEELLEAPMPTAVAAEGFASAARSDATGSEDVDVLDPPQPAEPQPREPQPSQPPPEALAERAAARGSSARREPRARPPEVPVAEVSAGPASRGEARLTLITRPWARVWIDGQPAGETPIVGRSVSAGTLHVRVQREGTGEPQELVIEARSGQEYRRYLELD